MSEHGRLEISNHLSGTQHQT